jgi:hypothetical protein
MNQVNDNDKVLNTNEVSQQISPTNAPSDETPEQINWKKFREERARERKEKEEIEKDRSKKAQEVSALKAALEALANKPAENSEREEETDEDKITRKVNEALAQKEREYEEKRRIKEHEEAPQRLASTYSDFNEVCNTENIDYLEFHYPEVAAPYKHLPDTYEKWAAIYKAIKRFVPNPSSKQDQKKAEKNFNKPQSMSAPGVTTTGDHAPRMLDDKKRADNWTRMQRVMRGG